MTTLARTLSGHRPRHQRRRAGLSAAGVSRHGLVLTGAVALPASAAALVHAPAADATVHVAAAQSSSVASTAPAAATAASNNVVWLRYGSSGSLVRILQQRLGGLTVDGSFGPKTLARLKAFQTAHHLYVDGQVGPATWQALGGYPGTTGGSSRGDRPCTVGATLRYGATGSAVKTVQAILGIPADGSFGPRTLGAVKSFQSTKQLPVTGVVDTATWKAMGCTGSGVTTPPVSSTPPPPSGTPAINLAREAMWDRIAWCESGQRWSLVATNSTGTYHGGLMMTHDAWRIGGGLAFAYDANLATREQQITVANNLYAQLGLKPWSCRGAA